MRKWAFDLQDSGVTRAMCEDVALLGSTHVVKNSKWNKQLGPQVCLCRISKVSGCLFAFHAYKRSQTLKLRVFVRGIKMCSLCCACKHRDEAIQMMCFKYNFCAVPPLAALHSQGVPTIKSHIVWVIQYRDSCIFAVRPYCRAASAQSAAS